MIPISLYLENFLSHSQSELHFDFSSALIIGENDNDQDISNGAGKSAIFEGIAWVLFGKSRCKYANSVVKDGRPACKVELVFEHDDKKYRVVRIRNAKYNSQNSAELYEIDGNGNEVSIKTDTDTELNNKIKEILHSNYEVFVNSSYFKQGDISGFLNGTTSQRQKIVSSILNLDRWDKYKDIADKKSKDIVKDISLLKFKLSELGSLDEDLEEWKNKLIESSKLRDVKEKEISDLNEKIKNLELKTSSIKMKDASIGDYQEKKSNLKHCKDKIAKLLSEKEENESQISVSKENIQNNLDAIKHAEDKIVELSQHLELKDKLNIEDFEKRLVKGQAKLDLVGTQIKNLENEDVCYACDREWENHSSRMAKLNLKKKEFKELESKILRANEKLSQKRTKLAEINKVEVEIDKYSQRCKTFKSNNDLHKLRLESAENQIGSIEANLQEEIGKSEKLEKDIALIKEVFEQTNAEDLFEQLDEAKDIKSQASKEKEEAIYQIGIATHKLETLEDKLKEKNKVQKDLKALQKEASIYSSLVRSFGRNGIQAVIIDNVMEELSKVTNDQLNTFTPVPTYVNFITQKKDTKGSWKETLDIEIRNPSGIREFDSLSGGEAFRVAFAIRLALSAIQARRMGGETQLLLLDEVSTNLDKHGLECFVRIIRQLEKNLKIMVITHDDKFKEEFEHIITVRKTGEDSVIIQH